MSLTTPVLEPPTALFSELNNRIDQFHYHQNVRIISTRLVGLEEPVCLDGALVAAYMMDGWEKWWLLDNSEQ